MKVFARTPLNIEQVRLPRGQVYLIPERCKGCRVCIQFCPRQVLQISEQANTKGYHYPEVMAGKEQDCVHCEFCTLVCPEFAIYTLPIAGKPDDEVPV
ncbi:MAG: 4Fe-4S binding protein [Anaerolineales bacterium]|nr:MAG: 4Fe-4S binding protein [Anaerolineales bacterium]